MNKIVNLMRAEGVRSILPSGSMLNGNIDGEYYCYLIDSGLAVVYPQSKGKSLTVVNKTTVLGLNHLLCPKGDFVIKIIHSSVIYTLPAPLVLKAIEENDHWSALAGLLSNWVYSLSLGPEKDRNLDTASLISQTIQMLQDEDEEVRLTYTVLNYVMDITGLSRSTVVRALEALKAEGKIEINKGLLMNYTL